MFGESDPLRVMRPDSGVGVCVVGEPADLVGRERGCIKRRSAGHTLSH